MLIQKITYAAGDEKAYALFAEHMGAENGKVPWPLPNMKQIEPHEYWHWATSWTPRAVAYGGHQTFEDKRGTLFVYHVDQHHRKKGGFAFLISSYGRDVTYFEWSACDHSWLSHCKGRCWTGYECTKCGAEYDVDSSG